MRDEQVRRYARHILLPDFGGLGQTAVMTSAAVLDLTDSLADGDAAAAEVAAHYLVAGGVGTVALRGATPATRDALAGHGPESKLIAVRAPADVPAAAQPVRVPPRPAWWPGAPGDDVALAFWRGGLAATEWMARIGNR